MGKQQNRSRSRSNETRLTQRILKVFQFLPMTINDIAYAGSVDYFYFDAIWVLEIGGIVIGSILWAKTRVTDFYAQLLEATGYFINRSRIPNLKTQVV